MQVSIADNGDVCVEFMKTRRDAEVITEVFRVSCNGQQVSLHEIYRQARWVLKPQTCSSMPNNLSFSSHTLGHKACIPVSSHRVQATVRCF